MVDKARVEGVARAIAVARDRLDALAPIGYSSAGIVQAVGAGVEGLVVGDRVACGGAGWANHAEIVCVPKNLVVRVPEDVDLADAAYATVGAIALHGIRTSETTVGERVGVIGLGLVGQLAMQILAATGCTSIGIDLDPVAIELASGVGRVAFARNESALEEKVLAASGGLGLDAVLVCASTASDDPIKLAMRWLEVAAGSSSSATFRSTRSGARYTRRSWSSGSRAPMARGATAASTRSTDGICRRSTFVGLSSETCRPFSNSLRRGG